MFGNFGWRHPKPASPPGLAGSADLAHPRETVRPPQGQSHDQKGQDMSHIRVVTWPRGGESLILRSLQAALGARAPWLAEASARDDGSDPAAAPPGTRLVIEHEEFPAGVVRRFAEAVAEGHPDGVEAFRRFASEEFGRFLDFMETWGNPDAPDGRLVVPREGLRADPAAWLAWASGALDPALLLEGTALEAAAAHLATLTAETPPPTLPDFVDETLAGQIGALRLRREAVRELFQSVMERPLEEKSVLHFQGMADLDHMRDALLRSREYKALQARKAAAQNPVGELAAEGLTDQQLRFAWKLFLARAPQPEELDRLRKAGGTLAKTRAALIRSPEFLRLFNRLRGMGASGDEPRVLVHIHVPKTAGTSFNGILRAQVPKEAWLPLTVETMGDLLRLPMEARRAIRLVTGHVEHGVGQHFPQETLYLTILRKPGPRLFSFYLFVRRTPTHPLHRMVSEAQMSFADFLRNADRLPGLRNELDSGQMRRLAGMLRPQFLGREEEAFARAVHNLFSPDMIFGLTEDFDGFLQRLLALGIITQAPPLRENISPERDRFEAEVAALPPDARAIYDRFLHWDSRLYDICSAYLAGAKQPEGV
ncbi:hypothetical protein ruthe_02157 [Rubellimicrobium thermophilum DSM 16684]|uniref:Sulfotransferase family n=1 Tax=Rubellimicrobium thermophilum DSM 16684 TaxID=1123069 RepID=S9QXZ6_9RHOB|nr:hypothetical protein [Rubellimicrobium thermophilum]EPX84477.1 hypothetical protein ruthe_02157 [Rubellimicrobium thermophilum DSM 16684]